MNEHTGTRSHMEISRQGYMMKKLSVLLCSDEICSVTPGLLRKMLPKD